MQKIARWDMRQVLKPAIRKLLRVKPFERFRQRLGYVLLMPWELPTVFGLDMANHYPLFRKGYDRERDAAESMKVVVNFTMTKYDRCAVLNALVGYVEEHSIPGCFVECGVWRGGSAGIMALANLKYGAGRRDIYLFDSWATSWPDPSPQDGKHFAEALAGTLVKADNSGAYDACRYLLETEIGYPAHRLFYCKGLFTDTVPQAKSQLNAIALLRIDSDWYESVKYCLEQLYDQIVPDGLIVIDDYGYCEGAKKAVDEFIARQSTPILLHYADIHCRYFTKPK